MVKAAISGNISRGPEYPIKNINNAKKKRKIRYLLTWPKSRFDLSDAKKATASSRLVGTMSCAIGVKKISSLSIKILGSRPRSNTQTNPLKSSTAAFRYVPPNVWNISG